MREIKFRGKRTDNSGWVYGYPVYCPERKSWYVQESVSDYPMAVFPETVGQYTGLKDKNGVDIYEGDVLRCICDDYDYDYKTTVSAFGVTLVVDIRGEDYDSTAIDFADEVWSNDDCDIEVVGNVHDNPNLGE